MADIKNLLTRPSHPPKERQILRDVICAIYKEIPDTDKNATLKNDLHSILDSLFYRAPEIISQTWHDIYNFLCLKIPLKNNIKDDPQWIQNIQILWKSANNRCLEIIKNENNEVPTQPPPISPSMTNNENSSNQEPSSKLQL